MRKVKFEVGKYYHIYNRGVDKRNIFNNDADKWRFLQGLFLFNDEGKLLNNLFQIEKENQGKINFNLLKDFVDKNIETRNPLVKILADCLMPNHYHLLLEEIKEGGISIFMQKLGGYTTFFNRKNSREGSLFQGPFKATEIKNDIQLQYVLAYINVINPGQLVKHNLKEVGVENMEELERIFNFAKEYSFSTNPDYLGIRDSFIIEKGMYEEFFPTPEKYEEFIRTVLLSKYRNIDDNLTLEN